ncbi:TIGR02597 family protein [Pelagicoccus mobilis]|uniref:TIGR02597 family protein n=1 Tax=Pelagicoccus mobilis TaxID=415221 RepID=A0A934VM27_9BACT|nr:TIGR02597 family protein [Pelagicoccus mobilis]MBK1878406.1 TIGR02597 family protein [Pelagicoccus mobilis]
MKNKVSTFLTRATALALFAAPFCSINAQEVYSATIGAVAIKVPSQSDVMVALPFKQEKAAGGSVSSVDAAVATLGASTLPDGEYGASGHYLYVEDGSLQGRHFDIVSNTPSTVTLDASDLTGLAGANISIRKHWTLDALFPEGVGYHEETEPGRRVVEVVLPEAASEGGGLAVAKIYYFFEDTWREFGKAIDESNDAGGTVVQPGEAFVVRNNGGTDLDYFFFGEVEYGPLAIPLQSSSDVVDNFVAVGRPLGLKIEELGLHTNPSVFGANDRLLVYPNGQQGLLGSDLKPTVYLYASDKWQVEGGDGTNVGGTLIEAGQGIAVRKAADAAGTEYWVNDWSISQ